MGSLVESSPAPGPMSPGRICGWRRGHGTSPARTPSEYKLLWQEPRLSCSLRGPWPSSPQEAGSCSVFVTYLLNI